MGYDQHNVEALRKMAASRKISGRAEMNRDGLVAALQADDVNVSRLDDLERRVTTLEITISGIQQGMTISQR
jgi:acylphosphatase